MSSKTPNKNQKKLEKEIEEILQGGFDDLKVGFTFYEFTTPKLLSLIQKEKLKEREEMGKALRKEVVAVQKLKMTKEKGLISIYQAIDNYLKKVVKGGG